MHQDFSEMRLLGLEPKTYGLKVCVPPPTNAGETHIFIQVDTKMDTARFVDPDLSRITAAWTSLPAPIKAAILALVQAAG
jgi:hypothetical protein